MNRSGDARVRSFARSTALVLGAITLMIAATGCTVRVTIKEHPMTGKRPRSLTVASDGMLWYIRIDTSVFDSPKVERMAQDGTVIGTYPVPVPAFDGDLARGQNGEVWYIGAEVVVRVDADGSVVSTTPLPAGNHFTEGITAADNSVWLIGDQMVGRMAADGALLWTTPLAGAVTLEQPAAIAPDGDLHIAIKGESQGQPGSFVPARIARVAPTGAVTATTDITSIPYMVINATGLTFDPLGNLWFSASDHRNVGRITTAGVMQYGLLDGTGIQGGRYPTVGPDSEMWFTAERDSDSRNGLGRIAADGTTTFFELPNADEYNGMARSMVAGPDGRMWYVSCLNECFGTRVGRVAVTGEVAEFVTPTQLAEPTELIKGPDGDPWFVESLGNKIVHIDYVPPTPPG